MKKLTFKIKSLKWQLLSRFFIILTVLFIIMGLSQYISMKHYLYISKIEILQEKLHSMDLIAMSEDQLFDKNNSNSMELLNKLIDYNINASIIDRSGNIVLKLNNIQRIEKENYDGDKDSEEYKSKKIDTILVPVLSNESYISISREKGSLEKIYKVFYDENNNPQLVMWRKVGNLVSPSGLIQLSTPINDIENILHRQVYMYLIGSVLILIIGSILGTTIFKRTLNPLNNITKTVEGINITDLDIRLPEDNGQLEIDRLGKSFNIMLERIESSFEKEQHIKEKMRHFVSDASHELKTPLTSIHGFVEILLRGAAKNEDQLNLALNSILMESERLTKLVNDLLMLTKLDQQPIIEIKTEDINDIIQEIFPQLRILCEKRILSLDLKDNIMVNINRNQIKQVIFNLTQNAVLHTDKNNGIITISTDTQNVDFENYAVLKIIDNGIGIPEQHLSKIYDRFFRSESHRSRESGGYGLGLSIVKSIVDRNHGKIQVESKLEIGTTFYVYLKLSK